MKVWTSTKFIKERHLAKVRWSQCLYRRASTLKWLTTLILSLNKTRVSRLPQVVPAVIDLSHLCRRSRRWTKAIKPRVNIAVKYLWELRMTTRWWHRSSKDSQSRRLLPNMKSLHRCSPHFSTCSYASQSLSPNKMSLRVSRKLISGRSFHQ